MNFWLWALIIVAVFVFMSSIYFRFSDRRQAASRLYISKDFYANYFRDKGIDSDVSNAVKIKLQEWKSVPDFPVLPDDNIEDVYGISGTDLDELVLELIDDCGVGPLSGDNLRGVPSGQSVDDLVSCLQHLRQQKENI